MAEDKLEKDRFEDGLEEYNIAEKFTKFAQALDVFKKGTEKS